MVNHIRLPAAASALLFVLFFPMILQQNEQSYLAASGRTEDAYLGRWLLVTGALFALSAIAYALRLGHATAHRRPHRGRPADAEHRAADLRERRRARRGQVIRVTRRVIAAEVHAAGQGGH